MCVTCKIPLNIADNSQATKERDLIRALIARGLDKQQIKAARVAEYGDDANAVGGDEVALRLIAFGAPPHGAR